MGGSSANNATGPSGLLEKELTLDLALRVKDLLAPSQHEVLLTREEDVNLSLSARAHVARDNAADAFVSIHFNGFHDPSVQGTETFTHEAFSQESDDLATKVQERVLGVTQHNDRGVKRAQFGVLNPDRHLPSTAACLLEVSFLTDPAEEERLMQDSYKFDLATAITNALLEYSGE